MQTILIAPCGLNCRVCRAFSREKQACPGCRGDDLNKSKSCVTCRIKTCEIRVEKGYEFCGECDVFPCERMSHLDKRYRTRYGTSPIRNLTVIKNAGLINFVVAEKENWTCPECGDLLCMHKPQCLSCGYEWLEKVTSIP